MSLFHKNINKKLAQHILELEQIGVLTEDWYWDSRKVLELERIDENLIKDLLKLYKSRKTDREKFLQILQKLYILRRVLKLYLKKSTAGAKDKKFVILINRFVEEIEKLLEGFPRGLSSGEKISNIPRLFQTASLIVTTRAQLEIIVDKPLIKACQVLYDKNIRTTDTSANANDIGRYAYITIDYDRLSKENKRIAEQLGKVWQGKIKIITIRIPVKDGNVLVSEIENKAIKIAENFKQQKMNWASTLTYEQATKWPNPTEKKSPQIIARENGWIWDAKDKLFYVSGREHYEKVIKSRNIR